MQLFLELFDFFIKRFFSKDFEWRSLIMDDDPRKSFFRITVYSHLDNDFTSFISDRCLIDSFSDRLANITDMTVRMLRHRAVSWGRTIFFIA